MNRGKLQFGREKIITSYDSEFRDGFNSKLLVFVTGYMSMF